MVVSSQLISEIVMKNVIENVIGIIVIALFLSGVYGWIMNIVHLVNDPFIGGLPIVRAIGIFIAPLGAVLGFC